MRCFFDEVTLGDISDLCQGVGEIDRSALTENEVSHAGYEEMK